HKLHAVSKILPLAFQIKVILLQTGRKRIAYCPIRLEFFRISKKASTSSKIVTNIKLRSLLVCKLMFSYVDKRLVCVNVEPKALVSLVQKLLYPFFSLIICSLSKVCVSYVTQRICEIFSRPVSISKSVQRAVIIVKYRRIF